MVNYIIIRMVIIMASFSPVPATFNCGTYVCTTVSGCVTDNIKNCGCNVVYCICNCDYTCTCQCNNCNVNSAGASTSIPWSYNTKLGVAVGDSILLQQLEDIKKTIDSEYDRRINDKAIKPNSTTVYDKPSYNKTWNNYNTSNINSSTWKEVVSKITSYSPSVTISTDAYITSADIIAIRSSLESYVKECLCQCNRTANIPSYYCSCQSYNSNICYCQCNYYYCTCQCDYTVSECVCNTY